MGNSISHRLKLGQTALVAVIVPVYWRQYGPANFLWFSDVALFGSTAALWLEHRLLASTQAVAVLVPEAGWAVDYALGVVLRRSPFGLAAYMFDRRIPLAVRALSLFHVWLPAVLLRLVSRLGYDRRALPVQAAAGSALLVITYALTRPKDNINWVFGFGSTRPRRRPGRLAAALVLFPLALYLPAHLLLGRWFGRAGRE